MREWHKRLHLRWGGPIKNTAFYDKLLDNTLGTPPAESVGGSLYELNYAFVGDEAFALRPDFLKPFSQQALTNERRIFNYRLSRARRVVENVFGILANRFRILHTGINLDLHNIDVVVLTCCVLHNFLRRNSSGYFREGEEQELSQGAILTPLQVNQVNSTDHAKQVRDIFVEYFNGDGAVYFQDERAGVR